MQFQLDDGKAWNISVIITERGRPLCDIIYLNHIVKFNKANNLLEINQGNLTRAKDILIGAKKFGIKVTLFIGSWGDDVMHPNSFTKVAGDAQLTAKFVQSVNEQVTNLDLDGINIGWFWPGCPNSNCLNNINKKLVASFLRALATQMKEKEKIFMMIIPGANTGSPFSIGDYFSDIVNVTDYFLLESHIQSGSWAAVIDFSFSLKRTKEVVNEYVVKLKSGREWKSKVVLTTDPQSINYELADPNVGKIGAPFVKNSKMANSLGLRDWCKLTRGSTFKVVKNPEAQNYAVGQNQLFIYDDFESLKAKVEYVMGFGLGMALVNFMNDDIQGECGCGKMPTLELIANLLNMNCDPEACF